MYGGTALCCVSKRTGRDGGGDGIVVKGRGGGVDKMGRREDEERGFSRESKTLLVIVYW